VAKHLIDTDLYIDLIQSGTTLPLLRELYDKNAPAIYFSSIVAQELFAGARSPAGKKRVEILFPAIRKSGSSYNSQSSPVKGRRRNFGQGYARQTGS
jgi:predicted nucleic acid-binding protein